jgi:mono/diheme cytochrome c family protein
MTHRLFPFLILVGLAAGAHAAPGADPRAFLAKNCVECHDAETQKGGVRLDDLPADVAKPETAQRWIDAYDKVAAHEMPPKKKAQPAEADRAAFLASVQQSVSTAQAAQRAADGRVVLRRLNRVEYENTIHDLLGVEVSLKDLLPEDNKAMGFDNVAAALNVSSVLMERYVEAADAALDAAIATGPQPKQQTWDVAYGPDPRNPNDFRYKRGQRLEADGTFMIFNSGDLLAQTDKLRTPIEGRYKIRFTAQAKNSDGKPIVMSIMVGSFSQSNPKKWTIGYFDAPADKPHVFELDEYLPKGSSIKVLAHGLPKIALDKDDERAKYAGPGLCVSQIHAEGPIYATWPPASHTRLFGTLDLTKGTAADAEKILAAFVPRAFRRPALPDELAQYVGLAKAQLAAGKTFEQSIRVALKAVLCSPNFLFLSEQRGRLTPYAVASRLSYFLWSSMPDAELTKLAANGTLTQPAVLHAQVERMLKDKRSAQFTENFTGQWLSLRQIDFTQPDKRLYPDFDDVLQWSAVAESESFFNELLTKDLSLLNFVDSKFAMLNERLAFLYKIPRVTGTDLRRVDLPAGSHRGGLLGQAAILKVTANGTSTSPVVRGAWVMRNLVGMPPKPPPPNVPAIEPDTRGATTVREQLEKHRSVGNCAGCHQKIDPPGNALENFDVIGGWRENYRSLGGKETMSFMGFDGKKLTVRKGPKVDTHDQWINGQPFTDVDAFKALLLQDKDQISRNIAEKLIVYGTGAGIEFMDRPSLEKIVANVRQKGYGFRTLLHEVVGSEVFLSK